MLITCALLSSRLLTSNGSHIFYICLAGEIFCKRETLYPVRFYESINYWIPICAVLRGTGHKSDIGPKTNIYLFNFRGGPGPVLIKVFVLIRPVLAYFLAYLRVFLPIFGGFSPIFSEFVPDLHRFLLWDRSHKNHFYGTGPLILGPVHLIWDRSPGNVYICRSGSKTSIKGKDLKRHFS